MRRLYLTATDVYELHRIASMTSVDDLKPEDRCILNAILSLATDEPRSRQLAQREREALQNRGYEITSHETPTPVLWRSTDYVEIYIVSQPDGVREVAPGKLGYADVYDYARSEMYAVRRTRAAIESVLYGGTVCGATVEIVEVAEPQRDHDDELDGLVMIDAGVNLLVEYAETIDKLPPLPADDLPRQVMRIEQVPVSCDGRTIWIDAIDRSGKQRIKWIADYYPIVQDLIRRHWDGLLDTQVHLITLSYCPIIPASIAGEVCHA